MAFIARIFSDFKAWLIRAFWNQEIEVTMVGIQGAGKTTLLRVMAGGSFDEDISPTIGFNTSKFKKGRASIKTWDISGQLKYRKVWERYCKGVNVIVYVVDSNDKKRIKESKKELRELVSKQALKRIPLLVLGNKNDLKKAVPVKKLIELMELDKIKDREVCCYSVSAKNKNNLNVMMKWLIKHSKKPENSVQDQFALDDEDSDDFVSTSQDEEEEIETKIKSKKTKKKKVKKNNETEQINSSKKKSKHKQKHKNKKKNKNIPNEKKNGNEKEIEKGGKENEEKKEIEKGGKETEKKTEIEIEKNEKETEKETNENKKNESSLKNEIIEINKNLNQNNSKKKNEDQNEKETQEIQNQENENEKSDSDEIPVVSKKTKKRKKKRKKKATVVMIEDSDSE
ncbi:adp-ribosylation factor-like protein [Anaeramoeba flamelloides]|uniref:Adp-ribosylation factor-like protein n=1 Tax=Anaeramoeba flamelloides TaxID=1746091 RepID=A0ABQ8Y4F1_9EUKA|nr:adp-ribosylation factor-like protein [Anaeramoeba flamelloides]